MQYNPYQPNHMPHQAQPEQYRSAKSKLKQMLK